jgi:hypothetical protein
VARLLKRFGVRPLKAKIESRAMNCYDRTDPEPAWNRYGRPVEVGTPEPVNDSGSQSTMAGWNADENSSDPTSPVSSMNAGSVRRSDLGTPLVRRTRVER